MNTSYELLIFVKNARAGKVKTRLATIVGPMEALAIYKQLLKQTLTATKPLDCTKSVYFSDNVPQHTIWPDTYRRYRQQGDNLGDRMAHAFRKAFERGSRRVVIIGSDCPYLQTSHLHRAFKALQSNDFVIGPSQDGGYYLLGMRQWQEFPFRNKAWSTDKVFESTLRQIEAYGRTVALLPELNDIDTFEDWQQYRRCNLV